MQFIILGYDGTDEGALDRRMAVREKHLSLVAENREKGSMIFGAAILNDEGKMAGSLLVYEFESRAALDEYLKIEPYVTGDVWRRVEVLPARVAAAQPKS